MFARRKHRPQEGEPLVPHGLIWQATDEPSPDPQGIPAKHPASTPAAAIEVAVRQPAVPEPTKRAAVSGEQRKPSATDSSASKLGAISPPIAWPSPKTASVIRRPIEGINSPSVEVTDSIRSITREAETAPNAKLRSHSSSPNLASNTSLPVVPPPTSIEPVSKRKVEVIELGGDEPQPPRGQRFRAGLLALLQFSITCATVIGHGISKCLRAITTGVGAGNQRLQAWWTSTSPRVSGELATARQFAGQKLIAARTNAMALAQRARNKRVRVRIVKPAYLQELIARSRVAWDRTRENIRRESRLWGSMAMAGLSALLAVGVISGISRYAPSADASRRNSVVAPAHNSVLRATPSSRKTQRASTSAHESEITTEGEPAKPSPLHKKAAVKPTTAPKTTPKTKAMARRARRVSDEDDYVAPDTYHYYGNGNSR